MHEFYMHAFKSIQSVPCSTPVFSVCGFRLWWNVSARKPECAGEVVVDAYVEPRWQPLSLTGSL